MRHTKLLKNINSMKGFSLIEMMIAVAILGIVSAIAVPSYMEHVRKGKRADAKVELLRIAQMQESYFVNNLSYAQNLTTGAGGLGIGSSVKSEQGEYTITVSSKVPANCDGQTGGTPCTGYTLTATASGSQVGDTDCGNFTLSNTGKRDVSVTGHADMCWK